MERRMETIYVFCCLLYVGASINVEGFERGEVSFQCQHKFARKNHKYLCKDPCKVSDDILVTVESGRRAESGDITLVDSGDGAFTVTFSQLQLSDSGIYWCGVDRPGFDTYTEVQLTVKKESNYTDRVNQNISTGTVLYTIIGALVTLTIWVSVTCFRKLRKNSKLQPQVNSHSTDIVATDERKVDSEYDGIGEDLQSIKKASETFSCTHHPKQDLSISASTAAERGAPLVIYENICCSTACADARRSAAHDQDKHDISSRIYIRPLPPTVPERAGDGSLGEDANETAATKNATSKPTESCANSRSACLSRSRSDSEEARPRSLWFGLDLSGTV
ncbi:uncharacterized protein LOC119022700 isoform X2 [Acanthopagrus latus]|uniref:uncharacterized protein LOC119022700 isoform X2 n=1 Tax=Acanthopagrus latus TaxID=8177 RepID=UPI00187BD184|nr:uncharacterized protein LOC119022700 isoform X2 [Acanthopagrus latus]